MGEFERIRREIYEIFRELPETIDAGACERQYDGTILPPVYIVATLRDGTRLRYIRKSDGENGWRYEKDGWVARRCRGGWQEWGEKPVSMKEAEKMIKDSGERTEFQSGAVRDMHEGKGRMDLLPWAAILAVSKHCEAGAIKYGEHNVDRGIPTHSLLDSAMRHAAKYLSGQDDEDHLLAAAWNLLWAVEMRERKPECVDTPWRGSNES